ncbi:MAG TPA: universal stress protein [Acidimicrobiia bacterium]|nr:universal stress protein [Acidimicrobiia bacterium]
MTADNNRPVLVPVDFSAPSAEALVWAGNWSAGPGYPLIVLHVIHDVAPGAYVKTDHGHFDRYEAAATEMMEHFIEKNATRQPAVASAERLLVEGLPVTRILEIAETREVQHIVMGSQGRTGLSRLMLGSKAERIVQLAPIPVTIVKGPPAEPERASEK